MSAEKEPQKFSSEEQLKRVEKKMEKEMKKGRFPQKEADEIVNKFRRGIERQTEK